MSTERIIGQGILSASFPQPKPQPIEPGSQLVEELSVRFKQMLDDVNHLQVNAENKMEEFATSPDKDIHGTMIAMQKADVSLRLLLEVRSRLTTAYQEIMRTQL